MGIVLHRMLKQHSASNFSHNGYAPDDVNIKKTRIIVLIHQSKVTTLGNMNTSDKHRCNETSGSSALLLLLLAGFVSPMNQATRVANNLQGNGVS
jgi:hypothetical protein